MDNRRTVVIILIAVICLLLLLLLNSTNPPVQPQPSGDNAPPPPETASGSEPAEPDKPHGGGGGDSFSSSGGGGSLQAGFSSYDEETDYQKVLAEMKSISNESMRLQDEIDKKSEEWLQAYLNDPNLSTDSRELYRLRSNKDVREGLKAYDSKDWRAAIKELQKVMDDPNATPMAKYTVSNYMRACAVNLKDEDLYIQLLQKQAEIIQGGDFSHLGFDADDGKNSLALAKDIGLQFKADKDPAAFDEYLDFTFDQLGIPKEARTPEERTRLGLWARGNIKETKRRIFGE